MKKFVSALLLLSLLFTLNTVCFATEGVSLPNGDFSDGTTNWTTVNADIEVVQQTGANGAYGKVVMKEAYGRAMYKFRFERNVQYIISVDVRIDEGKNTANLIVDHRNFGDKSLILSVVKNVNVSDKWARVTGYYSWDGEGTGEAQLYVRVGGALEPIAYYMDNLTVEKLTEKTEKYSPTEVKPDELIENFGFENGTSGYISNGAYLTGKNNGANNTEKCVRVEAKSSAAFLGQKIFVQKNTKYEISAFVKSQQGETDADILVAFSSSKTIDKSQNIRDYSSVGIAQQNYICVDTQSADTKWTLVKGTYIHRGEDAEITIGIAPKMEEGVSCLVDELSVIKKGTVAPTDSYVNKNGGISINDVYYENPAWLNVKDGYAVAEVAELAALLETDYDNRVLAKGFKKLVLNATEKSAQVNGKLLPIREVYVSDGKLFADVRTICRAFDAEFEIENKTIKIKTADESKALSNLAYSLINDKESTVAFLGGGAAYGRGAGLENATSYRAQVIKWFKNKYTDCKINELNNTFWHADSGLAVYTIEKLVQDKPDVVFIDFAPEDSENTYEAVVKNLEGVVAKIKKDSPKTDIVVLIGYFDGLTETETVAAYDYVAKEYSLPLIDVNMIMSAEMSANKKKDADYMTYLWFPNDLGHKVYADAITSFVEQAFVAPSKPQQKAFKVQGTLNGSLIDVKNAKTNGFKDEDGAITANVGATLELKFEGNSIGVLWESGIDTGAVDVEIDGVKMGTFNAFDRFGVRKCKTHYQIFSDNLKSGKHTLKITVSDKKDAMSLGNRIKIEGFLVGTIID
ncbi:MAG: carbohydrate binding domain-containing protein [Clostridia bacterium]|nr:carbohydrate binding domain-containing protein [Clostridia bacterium]